MIDGCATCSARASCRKRVPRRLVALRHAAQDADGDRMPERAVHAAMDRAAETAGPEQLADLVGAEQSDRRPAHRR